VKRPDEVAVVALQLGQGEDDWRGGFRVPSVAMSATLAPDMPTSADGTRSDAATSSLVARPP
jgi:hypothetical protein